ncbi:hypothetical protein ACFX11_030432 [Malus domestica]
MAYTGKQCIPSTRGVLSSMEQVEQPFAGDTPVNGRSSSKRELVWNTKEPVHSPQEKKNKTQPPGDVVRERKQKAAERF